jgi:hypothetical protein
VLDAADEGRRAPFGLARELDRVQTGQQLAEQGDELDPGQRRAQAVVRAEPEGEVAVGGLVAGRKRLGFLQRERLAA